MNDLILFEERDGIAILTLNRPEKLNAINYATCDWMQALLDRIEAERALRGVILTGAGRAFSAGGDIAEFSLSIREGVDVATRAFVRRGQAMTARIEAFPKPFLVAINGLAFGGGCEIIEAAALAISSDQAVFSKPEIAVGIPPTFGGTQRLSRVAGRKRALEMLLTADRFGPDHALAVGLINRIVPHADLMIEAEALMRRIIAHSSVVAEGILTAVNRGLNMPIGEGLLVEQAAFQRVAPSSDTREAQAAWLERRPPVYSHV